MARGARLSLTAKHGKEDENGTTQDMDRKLQRITTSVSSFERLRENNYVYVDKTALFQ